MSNLIDRLKKRWGVANAFQVIMILVVFSITEVSNLYVHRFIKLLPGIGEKDPFWIKLIVLILIIIPVWSVLLYLWGMILGQGRL